MNYIKPTKADRLILGINSALLIFAVLVIVVPLIYIVVGSFMEPTALLNKGFSFDLKDYSLQGYNLILSDPSIIRGFGNSIYYSLAFTISAVSVTVLAGYTLSHRDLVGGKFFSTLILITMFFGGGLIPTYLVVKNLGLLDTVWALALPSAVSGYYVFLARTFFNTLPKELKEAAKIDGASEFQILLKVIVPLSKPIIFVLALYNFVGHWNDFFQAMIYLQDQDKYPLQMVLRRILILNKVDPNVVSDIQEQAELSRLSELMKYSSIVISSLPLLIIYPYVQKYFEKGAMVGSLK
ncbi:carbohydrate ABC transporter permease [Candidatus Pristimantibacillus sp. PTI5]|uniref:carbohydrate ABC transporter permease n=1 Tax=Candidatus Pristimantibacillus sp. PTI5 TaxID=3400422 RepID=UPI003B010C3F